METATFDLSKLSTVLNNEVVKRSIYVELVKRIDIVDWFKQTKSWRKKGNKNGGKINRLIEVILLVKVTSTIVGHKIL